MVVYRIIHKFLCESLLNLLASFYAWKWKVKESSENSQIYKYNKIVTNFSAQKTVHHMFFASPLQSNKSLIESV